MQKIKLSSKEIKQIFEVAQSCISGNASRPLLQYAKASVEGKQLTVISCNGYKLARLTTELSEDCGEVFDFYFQPFKLPKGTTGAEIEKTDDAVEITLACEKWNLAYTVPQPQGDYVNADKIFPQTDASLTVALNASMLIEALKPFTKTSNRNNYVQLNFVKGEGISKTSPVVLSYFHDKEKIETVVLPIREA